MLKKSLCYYTADKGAGIIISAGMKNLMNFALQINVKEREKERGGGGGDRPSLIQTKTIFVPYRIFLKIGLNAPPLPAILSPFCLCLLTSPPSACNAIIL